MEGGRERWREGGRGSKEMLLNVYDVGGGIKLHKHTTAINHINWNDTVEL